MGISAYRQVQKVAETPRSTEYRLFGQVTGALMDARETGLQGAALMDILHWNRELWMTLGTSCKDSSNALPNELRAAIISLSLWVDRYSSDVMAQKGDIQDLIDVNRQMMEGLSGAN